MQRTKTLTTPMLLAYKLIVFGLISSLFVLSLQTFFKGSGFFESVSLSVYGVLLFFYVAKRIRKMKYVEYDDSYLYVKHRDYQIQIPFEHVKDVNIVSLDGVYKFTLYQDHQIGKEILCKTSVWYPLNYKKVDVELNRVRAMIRHKKTK